MRRGDFLTRRNVLRALLVSALFAVYAVRQSTGAAEGAAKCETDTECAAYCPPPADEPECDGGPEQ